METFALEVIHRLPLAEAVWRVLAFGLHADFLEQLFQDHRRASYTRELTFANVVHLVSDALFAGKSGLSTFQTSRADGTLTTSVEAVYGKLSRMPPALSMALLQHTSERIQGLFPAGSEERPLPPALAHFLGTVVDGKVSKGVSHRHKALRQAKGGLIGGRSLVAYDLCGRVLGFHGEEDGDANDVRFFPALADQLRQRVAGPRLWIADRQFATLPVLTGMQKDQDAFVVRYSKAVGFTPDPDQPAREGLDAEQRPVVEAWGWLGKSQKRAGMVVRRITVQRVGQEPLMVLTSLLEAETYPAAMLLEVYRARVDIEYVFQRITEVFHLRRLIASSPRGTLFQLSLCLLLYNVLQLVRGYVAVSNAKAMEAVSPEKLLGDVREEMIALSKLLSRRQIVAALGKPLTAAALQDLLAKRLTCWQIRWTKAKRRRKRPAKPERQSGHACAHRILIAAQQAARKRSS